MEEGSEQGGRVKTLRHRSNTEALIELGLRTFDGLELDVRTNDWGLVVVEHHPGEYGGTPLLLADYLSCVATGAIQLNKTPFLAINVKCNGLCDKLVRLLRHRDDYFLFDVPGEELPDYSAAGLRVFSRWSEYDRQRPMDGVVIDCFEGDYRTALRDPSIVGRTVAVIGEDLRGRPPLSRATLSELRCEYLITKERPTWA